MPTAKISALGCYVPPKVLTNDDLSQIVDTNDKWIVERTGIRERHIADSSVATSDLALAAAREALANRGIGPEEIDTIIVCTVTPDMMFPSTACLVQHRLGATGAWGFDLVAACSGFVYGLTVAAQLVRSGSHQKVLVIGADTMSRIIDYTDRSTCILFGDGAGAFLVEASEDGSEGYIAHHNEVDGSGAPFLNMPAGGSRFPASADTVARRLHYVKQEGQPVFKFALDARSCLQQRQIQAVQLHIAQHLRHGSCGQAQRETLYHRGFSSSGKPADHYGDCRKTRPV